MTRREFIENVNDFDDLKRFCYDEDCDMLEDVVDSRDMKDAMDEEIREAVNHWYWYDIRDRLDEIPQGYYWYHRCGLLDWEDIDDCFEDWKADVLGWADENEIFEEEDEEEEDADGTVAGDEPFDTVPEQQEDPEDLNGEFSEMSDGIFTAAADFLGEQIAELNERMRQIDAERREEEARQERAREEQRKAVEEAFAKKRRADELVAMQENRELCAVSASLITEYF